MLPFFSFSYTCNRISRNTIKSCQFSMAKAAIPNFSYLGFFQLGHWPVFATAFHLAISTKHICGIFFRGAYAQMMRVYASCIVARMQNKKTIRYLSVIVQLPRKTMGVCNTIFSATKCAISSISRTNPFPTSVKRNECDFGPKLLWSH